ncbi:MAG: hypothetical protein JWN32_36 [Solirubrobacterales bacterium]|nr:hypothetical protein [Solirubrobacterales bacterium]
MRIGVSACLLGRAVRYDGGHKREAFLVEDLAPHADLVSTCPEVDVGMGTPREPIALVAEGGEVRVRGVESDADHTQALRAHGARRAGELAELGLAGYVLKSRSPSCGLAVRVRGEGARRPGMFAAALRERLPLLPVVEEDALHDADARDHFLTRAYAHARLNALLAGEWTAGDLVRFHSAEKLLLLAHDPVAYAKLGRVVAEAGTRPWDELGSVYRTGVLDALAAPATRGRHVNTLQHLAGMLPAGGAALSAEIDRFGRGDAPRGPLLGRVEALADRLGAVYVAGQSYLRPYPRELMAV